MKITYVLYLFGAMTTLVSPQPQQLLKLGACEHMTTDQFRCAYQKSDCEATHVEGIKNIEGEKWWQPYRLDYDEIATCACDENTVVGACVTAGEEASDSDVTYRCAPNPSACADGEAFFKSTAWKLPGESWCGCDREQTGNSGEEGPATLYGACWDDVVKQGVCTLEPDDCETPYDKWVDAVSVRDLMGQDCTCSDVVVGGCFGGPNGFHCAVSSDTCDMFSTYYSPIAAAEQHLVECRLCPPGVESDTVLKGYSGAPTMALIPTVAPSVALTAEEKEIVPDNPKPASTQNNSSQNSANSIMIAVISFGVGLLLT